MLFYKDCNGDFTSHAHLNIRILLKTLFIENRNEIWRKTRATHQSLKTNLTGKYVGADLLNKIKTHAKSNSLQKKTGRYARDLEIHHMTPLSSAVKQRVIIYSICSCGRYIWESNYVISHAYHRLHPDLPKWLPSKSMKPKCKWAILPIDDAWSFSDREKFTACQ